MIWFVNLHKDDCKNNAIKGKMPYFTRVLKEAERKNGLAAQRKKLNFVKCAQKKLLSVVIKRQSFSRMLTFIAELV